MLHQFTTNCTRGLLFLYPRVQELFLVFLVKATVICVRLYLSVVFEAQLPDKMSTFHVFLGHQCVFWPLFDQIILLLLLTCICSLHILDNISSLAIWGANIFSHSIGCPFFLMTISDNLISFVLFLPQRLSLGLSACLALFSFIYFFVIKGNTETNERERSAVLLRLSWSFHCAGLNLSLHA